MFTIGSLFDGSGGFPLAAFLCGGVPAWAAEIEPYPIAVTRTRFPHMKHLGSVTDVNGAEIEPVDLITFGSPCQDLSVAGKRAGLKHTENGDEETTRSGLFMEAVRIIKEMREATNGVYPRFALWENVPGAFSSNKGEDFRIVLEELIKIVEPEAVMPPVPKNGWSYADHYCGDGWSLAYRTLDSQFWGVPQRRNRIHLVIDLRGQCAGEVLFEREGLRGYFAEGRTPWESPAGDAESGVGTADRKVDAVTLEPGIASREGGHIYEGVSGTLRANAGDNQMSVAYAIDQQGGKGVANYAVNVMPTMCGDSHGTPHAVAYTMKIRSGCEGGGKGPLIQEDMSATLSTLNDQYLFQPVVLNDQGGSQISVSTDGISPTLRAESHGHPPCVMESAGFKAGQSANARSIGWGEEIAPACGAEPGGNSVPSVCYCYDARGNGDGYIAPTITGDHNNRVTDYTSVVCCIDGDKIGKAERAGGSGSDTQAGDKMYTLTSKDAGTHSVCYVRQSFGEYEERVAGSCVTASCHKDATDLVVTGVDCRNATEYPEITGALQADCAHNLNSNSVVRVQYIVRRLTPTECARLQGFPDGWGHPDPKTSFTDEDYEFWQDVRNTHAEINGKAVKNYTREQILTWYNKLHTDSSEYKMWGNGIALPTALYVMQGIADVFDKTKVGGSDLLPLV